MKYANLKLDNGNMRRVDLSTYMHLRDENPELTKGRLFCPECGEHVHTYNEKAARGFALVNEEVTSRTGLRGLWGPRFDHFAGNNGNSDCFLYMPNDPRFADFHDKNKFDVNEKERNLEALARPGTREAIATAQQFFMHRLTGNREISSEDKVALNKIEKRLATMVGLADQLWILSYMGPVLVGARMRQMKNRQVRLEYRGRGWQNLPVTGLDKEQRILRAPKEIMLCFSRHDGKEPKPLINPQTGEAVSFPVSRYFAASIVTEAREKARQTTEQARQSAAYPYSSRTGHRPKTFPGQLDLFDRPKSP